MRFEIRDTQSWQTGFQLTEFGKHHGGQLTQLPVPRNTCIIPGGGRPRGCVVCVPSVCLRSVLLWPSAPPCAGGRALASVARVARAHPASRVARACA